MVRGWLRGGREKGSEGEWTRGEVEGRVGGERQRSEERGESGGAFYGEMAK